MKHELGPRLGPEDLDRVRERAGDRARRLIVVCRDCGRSIVVNLLARSGIHIIQCADGLVHRVELTWIAVTRASAAPKPEYGGHQTGTRRALSPLTAKMDGESYSRDGDISSMSIRDIRAELSRLKIDMSGCLEKQDLVALLGSSRLSAPPSQGATVISGQSPSHMEVSRHSQGGSGGGGTAAASDGEDCGHGTEGDMGGGRVHGDGERLEQSRAGTGEVSEPSGSRGVGNVSGPARPGPRISSSATTASIVTKRSRRCTTAASVNPDPTAAENAR